jgi:hypothetical protein
VKYKRLAYTGGLPAARKKFDMIKTILVHVLLLIGMGAIGQISRDSLKLQQKEIWKNYYRKSKGYRGSVEGGLTIGFKTKEENIGYYNQPQQDKIGLNISTTHGYQFWPYLYVAAGGGIDRYINYRQTFSPVFFRMNSEFLKKKITPFVQVDIGYSFMWKQSLDAGGNINGFKYYRNKGGLYIGVSTGIRIYTRSRASVIISIGYRRHNSSSQFQYNYEGSAIYNTSRIYQRLTFGLGTTF